MGCTCTSDQKTTSAVPTAVLREEHRVIETVLDAMERRLAGPLNQDFFARAIDFLRNFADGCHHAKEEDVLFPILESAASAEDDESIEVLLEDHEKGRELVGRMESRLSGAADGHAVALLEFRRAATEYIGLLRRHIAREDDQVFAMADRVLGPAEQRLLAEAFQRSDRARECPAHHGKYVALAEELSGRRIPETVQPRECGV